MTMQTLSAAQVSPEVPINENFESLDHMAVFGKRHAASTGLTWAYYGGRWGGTSIADGTVTLTNATANYVVVARATGAVSTATTTTNWLNTTDYARAYKLTTAGSVVTATEDHRAGPFGVHGAAPPTRSLNSKSAAYTTVLSDQWTEILHPSADVTARTFTIDSNANVPYPLLTELKFINQNGAGVVTIAITTDTMRLSPGGTTGSRSLAANGMATAKKLTSTEWIISGSGLT